MFKIWRQKRRQRREDERVGRTQRLEKSNAEAAAYFAKCAALEAEYVAAESLAKRKEFEAQVMGVVAFPLGVLEDRMARLERLQEGK